MHVLRAAGRGGAAVESSSNRPIRVCPWIAIFVVTLFGPTVVSATPTSNTTVPISDVAPTRLMDGAAARAVAVRERLEGVYIDDMDRSLESLMNLLVQHGVLRDGEQARATSERLCGGRIDAAAKAGCLVDAVVWAQLALVDGAGLGARRQPLPPHRKRLTTKEKDRAQAARLLRRQRGIEQAVAALRPSDRTLVERAERWLSDAGPGQWLMYRQLVDGLARYRDMVGKMPALPKDLPVAGKRAWHRPSERRQFLRALTPEHRHLLRQRLCFEGYCAPALQVGPPAPPPKRRARKAPAIPMEPQLAARLRAWQHDRGLRPSALINAPTLAALSVPMARRVEQIRLSLQRIRDTGVGGDDDFLIANIPAFRLDIWRQGRLDRSHRTQVGKGSRRVRRNKRLVRIPGMRTPLMSTKLRYLVLNPEWVVPSSIRREFRYKVRANPNWYAENGFDVRISSNGGESLVMRSGEKNLLGVVKFVFPNQHLVYLHDTPSQRAFRHPVRLKSHGCVRVEDAPELARYLLGQDRGRRLSDRVWARKMDGAVNKWISLRKPLPIHLVYWTADVSSEHKIRFYPDPYGYDAPDRTIAMQVADERLAGLPRANAHMPAGPAADDCPGGAAAGDCP